MFVIGTTEVQFMSYLNLVHDRLLLINRILMGLTLRVGEAVKIIELDNSRPASRPIASSHNVPAHREIDCREYSFADRAKKSLRPTLFRKIMQIARLTKSRVSSKTFPVAESQVIRVSDENNVNSLLKIYTLLENVSANINSAYGIHIIVISIMKFTTMTTLLYFCCMIIIK